MPCRFFLPTQPFGYRTLQRASPRTSSVVRRSASHQTTPWRVDHGRHESPGSLKRDVVMSILESSPTRRDAKAYIQKYLDGEYASPTGNALPRTTDSLPDAPTHGNLTRIAVVNLRRIQETDDALLAGVAKTLSQLRALGLFCVIVVDCGPGASPFTLLDQAHRVSRLVDGLEAQRSHVLHATFRVHNSDPGGLRMDPGPLSELLRKDITPVIVPTSIDVDPHRVQTVDSSAVVLAVGKAITGDDAPRPPVAEEAAAQSMATALPLRLSSSPGAASVERVIILDPLGALPLSKRPGSCHRLVNLHQEAEDIITWLSESIMPGHAENLRLARDALHVLPSMSSVLITSPSAAAHRSPSAQSAPVDGHGIASVVRTRVAQNPLIHNLLTDKPIYSSSLPIRRIYAGRGASDAGNVDEPIRATLVKRGLPLTIYPDPRVKPWTPPVSSADKPRLTDARIDLERLTSLINDSFGRRLDVEHYLNRVNQNLAGVVVAGNYEGCAILTWEIAVDSDTGRQTTVPYLDKFAVLRSRQGNSGVADFLFNALAQDCFPDGLCWRSRKTNPVNKWYFERSTGFLNLEDTDWTMFWIGLNVRCGSTLLNAYEAVCRSIEPSWE